MKNTTVYQDFMDILRNKKINTKTNLDPQKKLEKDLI